MDSSNLDWPVILRPDENEIGWNPVDNLANRFLQQFPDSKDHIDELIKDAREIDAPDVAFDALAEQFYNLRPDIAIRHEI